MIDDWYCDCKSGPRTVGYCSHVTDIVFYFKNEKYSGKLKKNSSYKPEIKSTKKNPDSSRLEISKLINSSKDQILNQIGLCILTENNDNFAYNRLKIVNTCSIDHFLLTFWVSKIPDQNIINILEKHRNSKNQFITIINEIINLIGSNQWNRAKSLWIIDVCK